MLAAIAGISLLVIPVVRSAEIDVTVGGIGIIQYTPSSVVSIPSNIFSNVLKLIVICRLQIQEMSSDSHSNRKIIPPHNPHSLALAHL